MFNENLEYKKKLLRSIWQLQKKRKSSPNEPKMLKEELHLHQEELEMQNQELRESNEALEGLKERYVDLYDFSPISYFTLSQQGIIQRLNHTAADLLGYNSEYIVNKNLSLFIPEWNVIEFYKHLERCLQSDKKYTSELFVVNREGEALRVEITSIRKLDPMGQPYIQTALVSNSGLKNLLKNETQYPITIDETTPKWISSIAQTNYELKNENEKLIYLSKAKSEFTAMFSHELRTPLCSIREGISLILDEIEGPVVKAQKETLNVIQRNIDRLTRLITHFLDFSKLECEKMSIIFEDTDINNLVIEISKFMQPYAKLKNLHLSVDVPNEPIIAICAIDQINQALINLLHNAVKFSEEEGSISIKLSLVKDKIKIEIRDSAVSIAKKDQGHIFDLFKQGSKNKDGSGIGLAVCKLIMDRHRGKISVKSNLKKGNCFTLTFPREHPFETASKK